MTVSLFGHGQWRSETLPWSPAAVVQAQGRWLWIDHRGQRYGTSFADDTLKFSPVTGVVPESDSVPDTLGAQTTLDIRQAWLTDGSDRYPHGALGDEWEATVLRVREGSGRASALSLAGGAVFEDNRIRATDLDRNGSSELLLVRSSPAEGAALVLYGVRDGRLRELAASASIGRPFRWRNPVGAGDLDGDGRDEVVSVRTPHLGGVLELHRWQGRRLVKIGALAGVSNHRYGSPVQQLSWVGDLTGDGRAEVLVPDQTMTQLYRVGWEHRAWRIRQRWALSAPPTGPLWVQAIKGQPVLMMVSGRTLWRYPLSSSD